MAEDLRRWLVGKAISARPVSLIEHAWRWCCRQPAIAALAATLILILIGGFVGLSVLLRRSEDLRSRSEANYEVASKSLEQLLDTVDDVDAREYVIISNLRIYGYNRLKAMEVARAQEIELSKRQPLDVRGLRRLAMIDRCLANFQEFEGKPDVARSLTEESIGYCEATLALAPDDLEIIRQLLRQNTRMLTSFMDSETKPLYELWNARAIATLRRFESSNELHAYGLSHLTRRHRHHAFLLLTRGESDRARQELEEDLRLIRSASDAEKSHPAIIMSEALTLAALGRWYGELSQVRSSAHLQPSSSESRGLRLDLAELHARRIGWLPSIEKSAWPIPADLASEAWTDRAISSIQFFAKKLGFDDALIPEIGWLMRDHAASTLGLQRRTGKLIDANRTADQLQTLAQGLTRSYPDQAAAYMLLSEAYVQRAKNAYKIEENDSVIASWERKSLDAAIHAATLESENGEAYGLVQDRRARLRKL